MPDRHTRYISRTPLGPEDYAAIQHLFGFQNPDDMRAFAEDRQRKADQAEGVAV